MVTEKTVKMVEQVEQYIIDTLIKAEQSPAMVTAIAELIKALKN